MSTIADDTTAKLFWTGRLQAVRLPKAFRFKAMRAHPAPRQRRGAGAGQPAQGRPWAWLQEFNEPLDEDFGARRIGRGAAAGASRTG